MRNALRKRARVTDKRGGNVDALMGHSKENPEFTLNPFRVSAVN